MNHYIVFVKKELLEYARTYKLLVMTVVFVIFGITNPLIAKLTPELISSFVPEGMTITIPEPSALDAWAQFFKNSQQVGLIVLVLVFSGVLSSEVAKGTLINLLTKGLSRQAVILAKYSAMALVWSWSVVISALLTWVYTVYLFPVDPLSNLVFSIFCLWLFGGFLLAVLLLGATLVRSNYGSLLVTGAGVLILTVLNVIPQAGKYNPTALVTKSMDLVAGTIGLPPLYASLGITAAVTLALIGLAVLVFSKKQL